MAAASFWRCIVNSAANNETIEIPTDAKLILPVIKEMMDSLAQKGFRTVVRVAGRMVILSRLLGSRRGSRMTVNGHRASSRTGVVGRTGSGAFSKIQIGRGCLRRILKKDRKK